MTIQDQIENYLVIQPEQKRSDMQTLHRMIVELMPGCTLWFFDGKDEKGKIVSNPSIGYGVQTMKYADGSSKEFYQVGISANSTGISVYIMGLKDKNTLPETFGKNLGNAKVTGYCIKFKALKEVEVSVLKAAIRYGVEHTGGDGEG